MTIRWCFGLFLNNRFWCVFSGFDVNNDHQGCPPFIRHPCQLWLRKVIHIQQGKKRGLCLAWEVSSIVEPAASATTPVSTPENFREAANRISQIHGFIDVSTSDRLALVILERGTATCLFKLEVAEDHTWWLHYRGHLVRNSVPLLQNIPAVLDLNSLHRLLSVVRQCSICPGHCEFPLLKQTCTHESKNLLKRPWGVLVGLYCTVWQFHHVICTLWYKASVVKRTWAVGKLA